MTRRERQILTRMANHGAFIWYLQGKSQLYPALCEGKETWRIFRRTVHNLLKQGYLKPVQNGTWILPDDADSFDISELGRAAVATS